MAPAAAPSVLVAGEVSCIGTHTVLHLLNQGFRVSVIDNLHNFVVEALARVRNLVGPKLAPNLAFTLGDLQSKEDLEKVFAKTRYDAVIRFARLKAVGESVEKPQLYFDNNLIGTLNLYEIMGKYGCKKELTEDKTGVTLFPDVKAQATNGQPKELFFSMKSHSSYRRRVPRHGGKAVSG